MCYNGPSLVNMIDNVKIPKRDVGGFTRACVSGKFNDHGQFIVVKVEKGQIKKGQNYTFMPNGRCIDILNIENESRDYIEVANAGENCRLHI